MSLKDNYLEASKKFGGPYAMTKRGVKKSIVDSIMRGSCPKADELLPIARVLESTIEELLTGEKPDKKQPQIGEKRTEEADIPSAWHAAEVLLNYSQLTEHNREAIDMLIDASLKSEGKSKIRLLEDEKTRELQDIKYSRKA